MGNLKFSLTERKYDFIKYGGVVLELNLSFDNVLLMFELFDDKSVREARKPFTALHMLVMDHNLLAELDSKRKMELLTLIMWEKLGVDISAERKGQLEKGKLNSDSPSNGEAKEEDNSNVPVVDFTIDAERIYSSFLFDYGIDLLEQQGKLMWNQFIALFNNLSEDSQMKIAIKYRTCSIPKKTEHNAEEIKNLKKLKDHYELPQAKVMREEEEKKRFEEYMRKRREAIKQLQGQG